MPTNINTFKPDHAIDLLHKFRILITYEYSIGRMQKEPYEEMKSLINLVIEYFETVRDAKEAIVPDVLDN